MRRGWRAGIGISAIAFLLVIGFFFITGLGKTAAFKELKSYQKETGIMQSATVTDGRIQDAANLLNAYDIENSFNKLSSKNTADGYGVANLGEVVAVQQGMGPNETVTVNGVMAISTPKDAPLLQTMQGITNLGEYTVVVQGNVIFIINPVAVQ